MNIEDTLLNWTKPSSNSEQEKQERTERMIRQVINDHEPFQECTLKVYTKGSYANNTNVKADSDVDIAVECTDVIYLGEINPGLYKPKYPYQGIWTPKNLRVELINALEEKFPKQVDTSGSTAIQINSSSARVNADVVPCFTYHFYLSNNENDYRTGTKIFTKNYREIVNYPIQQIEKGLRKNNDTNYAYKKVVRILKRVENAMVDENFHHELPSYFIECLVYNCPNSLFFKSTWESTVKNILIYIFENLQGEEPSENVHRWHEVNECFYLFHNAQNWKRSDGKEFAANAWNYLGFS